METLICKRCGASLRAEDGSVHVRCQYCGEQGRLGGQVLAAAEEYRQDVNAERAKAEEHALIARRYAEVSGGAAPAAVAPFAPVGGVVCRSCGAPTSFEVGAMISHCASCGASLLASDETRGRGRGEAARARRAARLEALKSERSFATGLGGKYRFFSVYPAVAAIVIPAVAALLMSQSETVEDAGLQALGFAAASALAACAVGGVRLWKRTHRERAEKAVSAVVERYDGRGVRGVDALGAWMNVYWSDSYDVYDLSAAFDSQAAACTVNGYPALVIVHPLRSSGTPFIDVLLSAWYDDPSEADGGPKTRGDPEARRFVQAQGFSIRSGPSGIHASLRGDACRKRLKEGIDFLALLAVLARIAETQGGRPQVGVRAR